MSRVGAAEKFLHKEGERAVFSRNDEGGKKKKEKKKE